jgi:hypothetical protein
MEHGLHDGYAILDTRDLSYWWYDPKRIICTNSFQANQKAKGINM